MNFIHLPMKMEPTVSSETSAIRTQTPGNYPKRNKLQLQFFRNIFEKYPNIKFHENLSSGSQVFPCRRTDNEEANSCFSQFREKRPETDQKDGQENNRRSSNKSYQRKKRLVEPETEMVRSKCSFMWTPKKVCPGGQHSLHRWGTCYCLLIKR